MSSNRINVNLAFNAETGKAKKQIQELQTLLNKIAYSGTTAGSGDKVAADLRQAAEAAKELQYHLNNAFNVKTGNFDLSLLDRSLKSSKASITDLSRQLLKAGKTGQQAFLGLAQSISLADQPMLKISNRLKDLGVSLKNAVKWQLSSSIVHGFMGGIQSAYGYAQDLNESLNNIRIVTGYNVDKMAEFADQANKAAKALSTTTTEYTDASLIYFQQGLSDADVKKRTDTTIKLANVTGQSVEETANQMTAIWNNFDDGSKSLDYYADVITALGAATASSSKEISEGLNKFSAVAESVGLSYEYASAALATVTATTRQSADIVGNAFKTLFARIQGLNLGETLDDGTTLNKYSQALFKVGIDIKDQSGQLKDMNTILDEMGSKWGTLSKDQQISLAQTVAGVRQYTQLIALMDEWDFFKENLGIATGAEGVLNKQADIYAESWEAASKRVKASAESIYQNLIDDEFFISINNGLANLLTGIGAFVKEMGGAKAILTGFASIFLSNFANKIPEAIQTVVYNLQLLSSKGTKNVYNKIEDDMQKATQEQFQSGNISEDSSMGLAITQANELTAARSKLTLVSNKLSASEKQMYNSQLSIIQQAQQEAVAIKQKNEQLEKEIQLQKERMVNTDVGKTTVNKASLEGIQDSALGLETYSSGLENILKALNDYSLHFTKAKKRLQDNYNDLNKTLSQGFFSENFNPETAEMKLSSIFGDTSDEIKDMTEDIKNMVNEYNRLGENNPNKPDSLSSIKDAIRNISDLIPEAIQKATGLDEVFERLLAPGSINSNAIAQDLEKINNILGTGTINGTQYKNILKELNGVSFEQLLAKIEEVKKKQEELAEKTSMIKRLLNEFKPQHDVKISEAFGSLAGGVGSTVTSVNSLISAFKTLGNEDLKPWERISGLITGISMAVPSAISAFQGLSTAIRFFGGPTVAIILAVVAAIGILITSIKTAEQKQKEAYETMKKSQEAYDEQKNTVKGLKDELESLNKTIDDLQKKGPLSLVEKQQLENTQKQKIQLEQQLALEQAILKSKQQQAIIDWKNNREDNANWVKKYERGDYDFKPGEGSINTYSNNRFEVSLPDDQRAKIFDDSIRTEEDFNTWFESYKDYYIKGFTTKDGYKNNRGIALTEDQVNELVAEEYKRLYQEFEYAQKDLLEFTQENVANYQLDLENYKNWYKNLTPEEKNRDDIQAEIAANQARLKEQGVAIYRSEEGYYESIGTVFQDSKSYSEVGKYILQSIDAGIKSETLGPEIADKFDNVFKETLNSFGISVDDYANYLATKYQKYNDILKDKNVTFDGLNALTEADGWKAEYLDLLDDITIKEGDSIDKIIANLKQKAEEIAGITQEQADLEGWTTQYAEQIKVLSDLKQGDKISAEDYATLGDAYQGYFQKQLDGTYMLTAAADELKNVSKDAYQASLKEQIDELKGQTDQLPPSLGKDYENWEKAKNDAIKMKDKDPEVYASYIKGIEEIQKKIIEQATGSEFKSYEDSKKSYMESIKNATGLDFETYEEAKAYVDQLNQSLDDTQLAFALSAQSIEELNKMLDDGKINQEEYDAALQSVVLTESQLAGIDFSSVIAYTEQMKNLDPGKADKYYYQIALAVLKQSQAMENLTDKAKDYLDVIKDIDTNNLRFITHEQIKSINDLADDLALLIGVEKEAFGENLAGFIASDAVMAAIEAFNNGVEGSIENLILLASLQASGFKEGDNDYNALKRFGNEVIEASKDIEVGKDSETLKRYLDRFKPDSKEYEAAISILEDYGFVVGENGKIIRKSLIPALAAGKSEIEKLSDSLGVSYDSVKKNAEILRTLYPELKNNEELSERMALAELAQSEAVKDLTDNYEDYINVLNTAAKSSDEYIQAYDALRSDLTKIIGITDTDILDSLINNKSIQDALAKVAQGDEGSITELRIAVATEYFVDNKEINTETIQKNLEQFKALNLNIPVGIELSNELDDPLEQIYNELKGKIDEEKLKTFFNDILGYAFTIDEEGNIAFTKTIGDITQSIKDQAEAFDINYEEVQDYASQLRENHKVLEDEIKLSEKIALAGKKQTKGIQDLVDNYEDYAKVLKEAKLDKKIKDTEEYSKAIKNLRKDISLITGLEEDAFSEDFINSDETQQALTDIINGADGAIEKFRTLAVFDALSFKFKIDDGELQTLYDDISQLNNEDIEIGTTINDAPALDALAELVNSVGMTADDIMKIFNSLGWEPEIEWQQMTAGAAGKTYNTGYMEVPEMSDYGSWKVNSVPLTGADAISGDTMVYVPVIKTKERGGGNYKKISPPQGYTPKSSPSGGGGGSAPKHAEKKSTGDKTRYHTLQNQLEDLKAEYDSISEAADRAFGKDKLKAIDSEISKTDELINKQKEYVDAIKANLPIDKSVMDAYYADVIGGNIQYDERGNISNYDAIQDAMFNKYNQMTDMYDEDSQEWQVFEKKYEQLEKYIEQYEETYDLLRDEEEAYQDLLRQRIDLKLEKIQYSVEVQLEIPDNEIAVLEYKLGKIEDDAFKSAEAIGLLTREAEAVYDQIQINKQGLNDVLKLSLSTQEILQLMSGDTSVLANKTFTADQIEAIKEYRDSLLDLNGQFDDMRETIEEKVMEVFDAWNEKLDSGISKLDHYGNIIQSYKNIIDIVGKDTLGLTDTFMATLNQSSIDNAINKLSSTKKSYEVMIDAQSKAEQALEEAKARNDESSIKMWEENLQSITEEAESAREEMLSAWEEALNGVAEQFEATVERVVDIFNKEVYTLGGLEGLSEDFSNQQEKADIMLDDYQKIYELSKLNRDINKSINDIDSLSGKQKLKKLLEQINALQEDGLEMSQYDLEYLQKTYDLRMAEIELEEARNAKNTVRLRKDNEGNWSYVYTQNMDAVDTAQQKYEDALYAMQEVSSNYIDEMSEKLISTSQEMEEALAAIRIQDFASIDDYYAEVQRVQQQYEEELLMQQNELQKAIDNNKILYDQDWTNYHNATGYKISDTENFATTFRDTLLGSLLGSEEDTANFTDIIGSAVNTLTQGLMTGAETYYANLEAAMNAAGTSTGNFAEDTAANIDAVVEKSIEGAEAVDQMAIEMIDAFSEITNSVQNWQESYGTAMQAIIDSNLAVIESFNQMLEALSIDPNSITVRYDLINSNNAPQQFASGGYTGEWGNYGKLAILDEKELILNQNDTTNFLKALGIAQTILDTIDLNATQASYGFGNLVPATINENNSQTIEQDVHITAEFPNATDKNEIEQAFETLINKASQYANRR